MLYRHQHKFMSKAVCFLVPVGHINEIQKLDIGAEEMGQWTKALSALPVDMDLISISSQHQHGVSRPSVIPVLSNPMPLLIYTDTRQACYAQTYMQAKNS